MVDGLVVVSVVPEKNQENVRYPNVREKKYQKRKLKTWVLLHHLHYKTILLVSYVWEEVRGR